MSSGCEVNHSTMRDMTDTCVMPLWSLSSVSFAFADCVSSIRITNRRGIFLRSAYRHVDKYGPCVDPYCHAVEAYVDRITKVNWRTSARSDRPVWTRNRASLDIRRRPKNWSATLIE